MLCIKNTADTECYPTNQINCIKCDNERCEVSFNSRKLKHFYRDTNTDAYNQFCSVTGFQPKALNNISKETRPNKTDEPYYNESV